MNISGATTCGIRLAITASFFFAPVPAVVSLTPESPPLTGPYGVGTISMVLKDTTREEILSEDPDDFRRVSVQLWYPAEKPADGRTVPYLADALAFKLARLHLMGLGIEGEPDRTRQAHGRPDAPVAEHASPFPLLLFSPALGVPTAFYRYSIEGLVSQGYAVAAVDHPYFSGLTVFPDGRMTPALEMTLLPNGDLVPAEQQPDGIKLADNFNKIYMDEILLLDLRLVLEALKRLTSDHVLHGRLDLTKFGIYGHSLGGAVAMRAASDMPACKAAVNIDGWSAAIERPASRPAAPLLTLFAEENAPDFRAVSPESLGASQVRYWALLEGAAHISFLDLPYLVAGPVSPSRDLGTVDPLALSRMTNALLLAFFDRYLKEGSTAVSLDIPPPRDHAPALSAGTGPDTNASGILHLTPLAKHRIRLPKASPKHTGPKGTMAASRGDSSVSTSASLPLAETEESPPLQSSLLKTPLSIQGHIKDAETGASLTAATIQVIDDFDRFTYTLANEDGAYSLALKALPAVLKITCIGYRSQEQPLTDAAVDTLDFHLVPNPISMQPLLVMGEDPARSIMKKVLTHKKRLRSIESYRAEGYERQSKEEDGTILGVRETVSRVFWRKDKGKRAVIKGFRGTAGHAKAMRSIDFFLWHVDFYNDRVDMQGVSLLLPTHPQALDHYDFSLVSQRRLDEKTVYDISFKPKNRVNSACIGTLSVLDEEYGLLAIDLEPSPSAVADFTYASILDFGFRFRQKFRPFERGIWLPVDLKYEIDVRFLGLGDSGPRFRGAILLTDYDIDVPLPDSVFADQQQTRIDISGVLQDSLFARYPEAAALTARERQAYKTLGVETEAARSPQTGQTPDRPPPWPRFLPELWFNRVDGAHLGFKARRPYGRVELYFNGAYKTGLKRWAYGGGMRYRWGAERNGSLNLGYQRGSRRRYTSEAYRPWHNTVPALLGAGDYFDYYWDSGVDAELAYRFNRPRLTLGLALHDQTHTSLKKNTDFDLRGRSKTSRANPAVDAGRLRSVEWTATYGPERPSAGRRARKRAKIGMEHSSDGLLSSDFSFTRYYLAVDWRLSTFFRHTAKPNALDLHLKAGASTGTLPVQRFFSLDGRLWAFAPTGVFRALGKRPYEGEKHLGLFWEHDFGGAPFEMLGLWALARRQFNLSLYGAFGRTWISPHRLDSLGYSPRYTGDFHHEIGLSCSVMNLVRLDLTRRLDRPQWHVGFSVWSALNER